MNAWWSRANRELLARYFRTFRPYRRSNRALVVRAVLAMLTLTFLTIPLPWITMRGIDLMLQDNQPSLVWKILLIWAVVLAITNLLEFYQGYCCDRFTQRVTTMGKLKLFRHIQTMPVSEFQDRQVGYLVCRVRDDIDGLNSLWLESLTQVLRSGLFILGALTLVMIISWKLTLVALLTLPLYLLNFLLFANRIHRSTLVMREAYGRQEGLMHDSFAAASTVKLFARETYEARRVLRAMIETARAMFRLDLYGRMSSNLGQLTQALAPLFVLAYAGFAILRGELTVGELVAFISYVALLFEPVSGLLRKNLDLQRAVASVQRIFEILDRPTERNLRPDRIAALPRPRGHLLFDQVSFSYNGGPPALADVDLEIPEGGTIGLAGPSGAGKSTLANLIPRLLEPDRGRILLDGTDLRDIPLSTLRKQIGVVAQDTYLFNLSIRDNIRYGRVDATDEEVEQAARRAYAHDFIMSLPNKYDTLVGNQGMKVSGGEKARIAVARALLKDPSILILDEATAFLDSRSEVLLQNAIEEVLKDRTAIVIAHRLSTIELTDRIVVVDKGHINEAGTHRELLDHDGLYRTLYEEQFERSSRHGVGVGNHARSAVVVP